MLVLALVGPSGSGKSYRAIMVANHFGADMIVDDGLLIKQNRIIAGYSAKQQPTRIAAIKTAIFQDEQHQNDAVLSILHSNPEAVLILGTSTGMVNKIAARLKIPSPSRIIYIDEIASPAEIKTALIQRNHYGNHVIPVPMAEVKRRVPTQLIRSLQVLFKAHPAKQRKSVWADQTIIRPNFNGLGRIYISESAVRKLIEIFIKHNYPGLLAKQIKIHYETSGINLILKVAVTFGIPIHEELKKLKYHLVNEIAEKTGLNIIIDLEAVELLL